MNSSGISAVPGIYVGHAHCDVARTGVTLILPNEPAVMAVDVRGGDGLAANGAALIDLDLGYRANVKRRPNGATDPYDVNCAIQGIAHSITPDTWEVELSLSPAPKSATEGNYLIMGDATRGKIGAAAANVLPY
jgi:hypothetical protein